jgi:hypothetical protein
LGTSSWKAGDRWPESGQFVHCLDDGVEIIWGQGRMYGQRENLATHPLRDGEVPIVAHLLIEGLLVNGQGVVDASGDAALL